MPRERHPRPSARLRPRRRRRPGRYLVLHLTYTGEGSYLAAWFANGASSSAAVDLLVAFAAGSLFMISEGRRVGMSAPWLYVVGGAVVAFAFSSPLFLLVRERVLHRALDHSPV